MISNLNKEAWDKKVIELGGSILQSYSWGRFNESLGHKIYRFSDQSFVNLAIETELALGKKYLYCPRGPLGDEQAALSDLKKLEDNRDLVFARIEPLHPVNLPKAIKTIQPTNNWFLNLEKSEEELLIGMKPKTRYNINLAERKGVTVRVGEKKDLLALWQLFLEAANRNQIRLHPQNYYLKMIEILDPSELRILLAEYQGQLLAGIILTMFGDTATYLHGGSSNAMKEAQASQMLHWEAIKIAKNLGLKNYDFGGVSPAENSQAWAGITRFKKGFGGFEVVYPGAFDLIYSPIWYNVYKQGRKLTRMISK